MSDADSPIFKLEIRGLTAKAQVRNKRFVVLKGSEARVSSKAPFPDDKGMGLIYSHLVDSGILVHSDKPDVRTFAKDYAFDKAGHATCVITRSLTNGTTKWFTTNAAGDRITYGAWRDDQRLTQ